MQLFARYRYAGTHRSVARKPMKNFRYFGKRRLQPSPLKMFGGWF